MRKKLGFRGSSSATGRQVRGRFEQLEERNLLATTQITVRAAGLSGTESMALQIDGATVQTWNNVAATAAAGVYTSYNYFHPTDVTANRIRVAFTNDNGIQRDLRIDRITVAGVQYESEAADTFSTGVTVGGVPTPGYHTTEWLFANGYFQFLNIAPTNRTVEVRVVGSTRSETIQLQIGGVAAATYNMTRGDYNFPVFQSFRYTHSAAVNPEQVRVVFLNDGVTAANEDRNVRVDGILVNGVKYESESSETFSTGTWDPLNNSPAPGYKRSEYLHYNGYLQYFAPAPVGGTTIEVLAVGATGEETMALQINGAAVRSWQLVKGNFNAGVYETFRFTTPSVVNWSQVRVAFTNDGNSTTGLDKNLRIDAIRINGVRYETEAASTFTTGFSINGVPTPGYHRIDTLYLNGYFAYGQQINPGTLALASSQYTVVEGTPTVGVTFVRTGGSDGTVTLDYTTVNSSAVAGQDYTAIAGMVTFGPGETSKTVNIAIANDAVAEGSEVFNVSADRVTGGAGLGAPRTATVRIIDDELPSPSGGNGLRGDYYRDGNLTSLAAQRTDAKIEFNWGGGSPTPQVGADNFSVRWTGQIEPLYSQTYTFYLTSDDGTRMWINNQLLIDAWVVQAPATRTAQFTMVAGQKYDIRVEYFERVGGAVAVLEWQSARQARQVIPQSQLLSAAIVPTSGNFVPETLIGGLREPTAIDFGPNGMMFIALKSGIVKTYVSGQLQDFIDISPEVNDVRDRGLLGLAVHPDFVNNPYVYLLYTHDPPEAQFGTGLAARDQHGNRVAQLMRVTADVRNGYRTAVPGSRVILLGKNSTWANISRPDLDSTDNMGLPPSGVGVEDIMVIDSQSHSVGSLRFLPDGSLLVSNGDGTSYGRVDPRSSLVQQLDNFRGKLIRINPISGQGYTNNPFYDGNLNSNRSKIVNYGLRNPFRFAVNPTNGLAYLGDVGWLTHEEINIGWGQNFGWPWYEGVAGVSSQTGGYRDLPQAASFYASNNANPPIWSRTHASGAIAIVVGDFYTGQQYPAQFRNTLWFTDFGEPTIRALTLNAQGFVQQETVVSGSVGTVIMMDMGPDGYMYYVDILGKIGRFNFTANASSIAIASAAASAPVATVTESLPIRQTARRAAFISMGEAPKSEQSPLLLLKRSLDLAFNKTPNDSPQFMPLQSEVTDEAREEVWRQLGSINTP